MDNYIKEIEKELSNDKNFLKQRNNRLMLTDNQIELLEKYEIKWSNYNKYRDLIFEIDKILEDIEDEELDELASRLQELSYYNETRK